MTRYAVILKTQLTQLYLKCLPSNAANMLIILTGKCKERDLGIFML